MLCITLIINPCFCDYLRFILRLWRLCVAVMKGSCCHHQGFVLLTTSVCLAKLVTVTRITMWPLWRRLVWNDFTSEASKEKERTLDSPNWEFAVIKLPVYLLQSPIFITSKPKLYNCLYIRQIQRCQTEMSFYEFCWQKHITKNKQINQDLLCPDKCGISWKRP